MARLARVVVPGVPHHVTQRGNRPQPTLFCDSDCEAHLDLLHRHERSGCPMGNGVPRSKREYKEAQGLGILGQAPGREDRRSVPAWRGSA